MVRGGAQDTVTITEKSPDDLITHWLLLTALHW